MEASIRPGVQRRRSGREVGRGQALYEDRTGRGKHQSRCTET